MGLFEKRRAKKFFEFIQNWRDADPATHQTLDLDSDPMVKVFDYFGLEPGTKDFIGHSMALHLDDSYLQRPARGRTTASSSTHPPWLVTASRLTSTLFTVSASFLSLCSSLGHLRWNLHARQACR